MTYSIDFRRKVLDVKKNEGLTFEETSQRFCVGKNSIFLWSKKLEPIEKRNRKPRRLDLQALKKDSEDYPDAYQYERAQRLGVSEHCIFWNLKKLNITYKKTLCHPKADKEKRDLFCERVDTLKKAGRLLVYLDESGFAHDAPRLYGYSDKGKRCYGVHDWGAKGRTNAIGALLNGILLTISLFQTTVDTITFTSWVEQDLIPKLPPKRVVIMDNASFHKRQQMKKSIEDAGHTLLYLPTYSPDLNPIEKKWSQAKAVRRRERCDVDTLFKIAEL